MSEAATGQIWALDPASLHEVLLDPEAALAQVKEGSPLERIWALRLLGCLDQAAIEAEDLLAGADYRFGPLLLLAHIYQCQYRWEEASWLQGEAVRIAGTPEREAMAHHHTGRRLMVESRYREAEQEFEWAIDLFRAAGSPEEVADASRTAQQLARRLSAQNTFKEEPPL
ncbi:hypothetical protein [Arthrobacter sp. VKM Ac-2550]|uniref:hypothetical protein n=1 Tax=Crystallibacter permensis TaxID=1938888 RepID=UPI0022274218|nr:hypothetical protein [Arthrobacter sp. VKM Ac-2550]MCW2133401.1 hypothetical protein [Arthrobacter sp. VKM Ac-2550]